MGRDVGGTRPTFTGQTQRVWEVAFSPDGKHLLTSSTDGSPKVWDFATGQLLFTLRDQPGVSHLRYSPDGTRLITPGASDGTIGVWDALTGQEQLTLSFPGSGSPHADISPDGSRLAAAGTNGLVRLYLLRLEDVVNLAHARLTRSLTSDECQRFLHLDQCPS